MITFDFQIPCDYFLAINHKQWLKAVVRKEGLIPGNICYLFCDDSYLFEKNIQFLNHDTYTDIITFDQCRGSVVEGNLMISLDRILDNANKFKVSYEDELLRVMVHGILHLCGYKDKEDHDVAIMRSKENEYLQLFHKIFCN